MPSTRTSKRQTRLAFTPLPSSSPQSASLPSHLQTRAASVRYDDSASPLKRRRVLDLAVTSTITTVVSPSRPVHSTQDLDVAHGLEEDSIMQSPFKRPWSSNQASPSKRIKRGLPTPDPSSQLRLEASDSDGETISSDTDSHTIIPKARIAQPSTPRSKLRKVSRAQYGNGTNAIIEDDGNDVLSKRTKRFQAKKPVVLSSDEDVDDGAVPITSSHQRRLRSRDAGESPPIAGQSRHPLSSRINPRSLFSAGHSESTPTVSSCGRIDLSSTKSRNRERVLRTDRTSSGKDRSIERSSAESALKQELSDSDLTLTADATLLIPTAVKSQAAKVMSDDESDFVVTAHRSGRANGPRSMAISIDQETEESEDIINTPSKRKRLTRHIEQSGSKATPRKQDDEDLEEDLEVLQDTELITERTRGKAAPSKRDAALEKLKARRLGQKVIELSSDSEAPTGPRGGPNDHGSISEAESQENADRDEDEEWRNEAIRQSLRDDEGEYDADFVDDEGEDALGAPGALEDIPLEFTRHAHKKTKEHFKDVVEWMVHKKLNPAFPRDDAVYQVGFHKLDDEVRGYAGSKFLSAAWMGDFAQAIKARPQYSDVPVPDKIIGGLHHCEACNRRNHPARFIITFGGKAYYKETLEDVSEDEEAEEDNSDDEESGSRNAEGFVLPSVDKQYYVGRYCKEKAEIAHTLLHWRYHLNDWILDWLKNEGYETPEKVVERDRWSIKKRSDYANKVVDDMEAKGEIKALYRDFKANLDSARNYQPDYYRSRG
ncbi:hypothetical protein MMC26_000788 [Xylographa opegraphella]|nr:hypothetical protein [Xylographa opegraphella]